MPTKPEEILEEISKIKNELHDVSARQQSLIKQIDMLNERLLWLEKLPQHHQLDNFEW